jgi:cadmium resistance protein CadD (predicted permease)
MMIEFLKFSLKVIIAFFLTNIQDIVILINFFLESSKPESLLKNDHVVLGQYLGFSTLLMLSLIGYTISYILPIKLFGFLGFLIIFFGLQGLNQLIKDLCQKRKKKKENSQEILEIEIEFIQFETVNIY